MENIKEKIEDIFKSYPDIRVSEFKFLIDELDQLFFLQKQETIKDIENLIRQELGMDCGYMNNEAWNWDLDNLPPFEDFINKLKHIFNK